MGFKSDKPYLVEARIEFTTKYGVATPREATQNNPARLKEWCALVNAKKKLHEGASWVTGYETAEERRALLEAHREQLERQHAYDARRRKKPPRERND